MKKSLLISVPIGLVSGLLVLTFQNCAPQNPVGEDMGLASEVSGNSAYRLPSSQNQLYATGYTCSVTANLTAVPVGGSLDVSITSTPALPTGYTVAVYGTKNGVVDQWGQTKISATTLSIANPAGNGGTYVRTFQILDNAGRALCQTNGVSAEFAGVSCTLSTATSFLQVGQAAILNITSATVFPAGAVLRWEGTNNGVAITGTATDYGSTNTSQWIRVMNENDRGVEFIRRLNVFTSAGALVCATNFIRYRVD